MTRFISIDKFGAIQLLFAGLIKGLQGGSRDEHLFGDAPQQLCAFMRVCFCTQGLHHDCVTLM